METTLPPGATITPIADATLPPPAAGSTLRTPALADVTFDPNAPQAQAYREAAQAAPPLASGSIVTGASFGHYQLLEPIAKGGMGIVYKARQRNLNRIVAIKMILAGQFADQADIDRFYAEAEAAATLRHPNIVAIHEIGEVQGQHFFSMDYVDGPSLSNLVHESPLPPRRAAELVRTIAETMQFAHDSGIVHRDLKPSNVLLDKKQRPLITDFGLAKQVAGQSQMTIAGAVIGTPSYMPPEQAAGDGANVGPWSDLYSLGAILYETLTGKPPFRAATPFETIRQVLDSEPLSPRLLNPGVPRDLETICLKCLQKERSRRYATAQELADELSRYLRGEPIQARPIGQAARFWRLCRRNPLTASAIAAAVLMLAATAGIMAVAYVQTSAALNQSEQSLREALGAVNDLFTTVSEDTLLNQPGMQPLRKDLLNKALTYYQRFLKQRANDPRVQDELAAAYFRIGLITEVLQSPDEALPAYETARQMQQRQLAARPSDPARLEALGNTLSALGALWTRKNDYAAALKEFQAAVDVRSKLAGQVAASSDYQRALANSHMNIGLVHYNAALAAETDEEEDAGLERARREFGRAQDVRAAALAREPANPKLRRDLGKGHYNLGNLEWAAKRNAPAARQFQSAADQFERLAKAQPGDLENQKLLAICYRFLGDICSQDDPEEARGWYRLASERLEPLAEQNPGVIDYQSERAGLSMNVFLLERDAGQAAAARAALEQAQGILAPLVQRFPAVPRYRRDLAVTLRELAVLKDKAGETRAAAADLMESTRILKSLTAKYPSEMEYAVQLEQTEAVKLAAP
ncbi:MAG TPA: protein kinase [Pirellulaceae bacterium]|nr:protein kinase [Pirellulaceae bacterium]